MTSQEFAAQLEDDARRTDRAFELTNFNLEAAVTQYLETQLWSAHDALFPGADSDDITVDMPEGVDRDDHGEMLDEFYDADDIDSAYVDRVRDDFRAIVRDHPLAVRLYLAKRTSSDFGHDFLLTRDGHGTGFWDRGLGELGDYLAMIAKSYGVSDQLTDGAFCSDPSNGGKQFVAGRLYG